MFKVTLAVAAAAALVASPTLAASCKDAKGRFVKCPPKAAATPMASMGSMSTMGTMKPTTPMASSTMTTKTTSKTLSRCRNAKGQYAKCGTSGAKPV